MAETIISINDFILPKIRNDKAIDGNSTIASDMRRTLVTYRSSYLRKLRAEQIKNKD